MQCPVCKKTIFISKLSYQGLYQLNCSECKTKVTSYCEDTVIEKFLQQVNAVKNQIHLNRCILACNVIGDLLDTMRVGTGLKSFDAHLDKIRRWHTEATLTLPVLSPKSANYRICKNMQKELHRSLINAVQPDNVTTEDTYTAWAYMAWNLLNDATCSAKDYAKGKSWRYLDQTMTTLALGMAKKWPKGEDIGHEVYMACETP